MVRSALGRFQSARNVVMSHLRGLSTVSEPALLSRTGGTDDILHATALPSCVIRADVSTPSASTSVCSSRRSSDASMEVEEATIVETLSGTGGEYITH